jgi:ABC-type transport system involved in multi-copper enzyme maturation permease subunit
MINCAVYFYTILSIFKGSITLMATVMFALLALALPFSPLFDPAADLYRQLQVLVTMYILCLGVTGLAQGYRPFMDLLMTRPLLRLSFVMSRWAAFTTCGLVMVTASALLSLALTPVIGGDSNFADLVILFMTALGAGALTACFNTCLLCTTPPTFFTHVLNSVLLMLVANESLATSGNSWAFWQTGALAEPIYVAFSATHSILLIFLPSLNLWDPWSIQTLSLDQLTEFLTPLLVSLAIATIIINNQEFSYATAE